MTAFDDAARVIDDLIRRVEQLEAKVGQHRDGQPQRTAYRPSEVAAMTGFATKTIQGWIRDGRLAAEWMPGEGGGGRWAVPAEAALSLVPWRSA